MARLRAGARLWSPGARMELSLGASVPIRMLCRFMHRFASWLVLLVLATPALWAQSTVPTLSQPLPNQAVALGASTVTVDLRNYFTIPGVTGQVAQFDTVSGKINVELLANDAPLNTANFLNYVNRGAYTNTIIHRSVPGFVIQGGGYLLQGNSINPIATNAPVKKAAVKAKKKVVKKTVKKEDAAPAAEMPAVKQDEVTTAPEAPAAAPPAQTSAPMAPANIAPAPMPPTNSGVDINAAPAPTPPATFTPPAPPPAPPAQQPPASGG